MQMLPRSLPENLDDLTVQVALVRPGPIQGGAVHPYLDRKARLRDDPEYVIPYEHPALEPILADTLGAIVFQDQVIQVAMALAGFSAGEAEGLRRAMSRKRSDEAMAAYSVRFVDGAVAEGVPREVAERVFEQVRGFSGFGFPKSHAAAFGLLAYQSTWLRVHRGPEFLCALLNEQPMGFYPPDALVHEAQRRGIELRKPDVNASAVDCTVGEDLAVQVGLGYVNGLRKDDAQAVVTEREHSGRYGSLAELASRSGIQGRRAGALGVGGRVRVDRAGCGGSAAGGAADRAVAAGRCFRRGAAWAALAASPPSRRSEAPRARRVGGRGCRLCVDEDDARRASDGAHARRTRWRGAERGSGGAARSSRGGDRGGCGGSPAARDGEGRGLHAARGRDGGCERDRPAAGLHGMPPGGENGGVRAGERSA